MMGATTVAMIEVCIGRNRKKGDDEGEKNKKILCVCVKTRCRDERERPASSFSGNNTQVLLSGTTIEVRTLGTCSTEEE